MSPRPLLVELDAATLAAQRERMATWLATVATLQSGYRELLGQTVAMVGDPLVHNWLSELQDAARRHEGAVDQLAAALEVRPAAPHRLTVLVGTAMGLGRELVGQVQGRLSGASGPAWRNLRQLTLANLDSMSAFAVAEQFGLALGRPRAVDITFQVVSEKNEHQLLLREIFLEFAADAVLYRGGV
jgi:hypothetical protein